MANPKYKLVIVEWCDSYTTGEHWQTIRGEKLGLTCTSVGWITRETKKNIQVTPHRVNAKRGHVCGSMVIPRSSIIKIKKIKT